MDIFIILVMCIVFPFLVSLIIFWIYYVLVKKMRYKKKLSQTKKDYTVSIFYKIFIAFPRQLVLDGLNCDPNYFKPYGVHIVAGPQGCGKTMTVNYLCHKYKLDYPLCKIKSNCYLTYQDGEINSYLDVKNSNNGVYGEIDVLDEIQNWFNSLNSRNFPPAMLSEVTQQRKQRKIILGTSQVFTRVAKPIRENTFLVYEPHTILGCLTIVLKYKPVLNEDGTCEKKKFRDMFFFVQTDELRNSYDTYRKIERLDFKSKTEQIGD